MRKFKNLVLLWVGACTALTYLLSPTLAVVEGATLPAGFSESVVFSGLTEPTAVRFSPDGRVFVAEKSGLVKVFDSLSDTTPTVFHDLRTNVHNFWDRGLMGLELHPNFPTIPYVYVLYTYDKDPNNAQVPRWGTPGATSDGCPTPPGATTDGCVVSGRLSQIEMSSGSNVSTGTEIALVEGWGQQFPSHSMDTVMFGPDGALYASAGDGAHFSFADYGQAGNPLGDPPIGIGGVQTPPTAEGGATRTQSLRRVSGPAVLNGTIIRVDPFTGAAMPDNPLFSSPDPNARRIVGYGFRNPFRFTFRPGTNDVWIGDVGWSSWEEIDRIPNPLTAPVRNFGWPCYEGPNRQASYDAIDLNICETLYAQAGGHTAPYFAYNHGQPLVAGDTCRSAGFGSAITGLAFNQGGSYPATYQGALFFADRSRRCISSMFAGTNGLPDPATRATFAADAAYPVDLQIGPGGDVFYVDFDGGTIRRIQYTSGNQAPNVVIQATPLAGPLPLNVTFDGSASSDPNIGDTLTYSWDLNGDGTFGDATTVQTSRQYTQANLYNVQLKVTDNHGASNIESISIKAGGPTAFIDTPAASTQWQVGQSLTLSGHATSPGQSTFPPSAFSWEIIMHHCPSNCHTHPIQTFSGVTTASFSAPDHEYPSHLEIKLTVTDAAGLKDTKSVLLNPQTVTLNFASTPSGLELVVGSSNDPTPFTKTVIQGSKNSVSAATPQTMGATTYHFLSWSDGGNQSHLITGSASASYTATYSLTADNTQPTMPSSLTGNVVNGTQSNLSWPVSTDNVGVTGYELERCQGVGCANFTLIATPTTSSYTDTGLTPGVSYSYRVRARDAVGNFSTYSPIFTNATLPPTNGRAILFTDPFNRTDNADLGTAYTDSYTGFTTGRILSQRLVPSALGTATVEQYTGVATPNNQWSEVTIGALAGGVATQVGTHVRLTNPTTYSGYRCFAAINQTNKAGIRRVNGGTLTTLGTNDTTTIWGAGDTLRCEIQGTTIKLYRVVGTTETLLISATDATYSSGTTGIYAYVAAGGTVTDAQINRFAMGGFAAAPSGTIPFDAVSSSAAGNTTNAISWSHSIGNGTNRFLAVCTQARDTVAGDVAVTAVTANGFLLTKVRSDLRTNGGTSLGTELWYLANPGIGAQTITVTWAGALSSYGVGSATSYFGVDPTAPIDTHAGSGGTSATLATALTTLAPHALITDCAIGQANTPTVALTAGAGQTTRVNRLTAGAVDSVGVSTMNDKAVAGAETMDWTQVAAQNWVLSAVSLRPASSTPPPTATIAFDAVSSSAAGNTTNAISWSHSIGNGTNRFLAVCTQARDTVAGDVAVTAVTANGFLLTKVRSDLRTNGGTSLGTELWYLASPGIGAYTITVTWAGALASYGVGSATSYFGVNQVTPIDAHAGSGGTGTTLSTAITTVANHALITDCAIGQANTPTAALTVGAGQTTRVNRLTTGAVDSVGVSTVNDKAVAGSETMDWTQVAAQNWVLSAVSLRPAP